MYRIYIVSEIGNAKPYGRIRGEKGDPVGGLGFGEGVGGLGSSGRAGLLYLQYGSKYVNYYVIILFVQQRIKYNKYGYTDIHINFI